MAPRISYARTTLPFPIFAADFDPYRPGYLTVGGGGGEGRSGVPNQISVLDVHNRASIESVADIELSRDEDSVQSLATLGLANGLLVYAGINSSAKDQDAGNNEHLRSFEITYPPRKKRKVGGDAAEKSTDAGRGERGAWAQIGKQSLFNSAPGNKNETYQRIARLSPFQKRATASKRICAISTGLAKESQIIVFDATNPTPGSTDVLTRISLPEGEEAADLDVAEPELSQFSVAYCTDHDIYEQSYKYNFNTKRCEKTPKGPRRVYQMPADFPRAKFRCLRFLNAQNVLALCNKPNKGGVELRILHLYPTGPAILITQKTLPSNVKAAVTMDVCSLDVGKDGKQQIAIAVAGQDISITVYTTDFQEHSDTFTPLKSFTTLKKVHDHQITKVCFSPFHSPNRGSGSIESDAAVSKEEDVPRLPGPQCIRLASVSYGNSVVVDTLDLSPLDPKERDSRYVLQHPDDDIWSRWLKFSLIALAGLLMALLAQYLIMDWAQHGIPKIIPLPENLRNYLNPSPRSETYPVPAQGTPESSATEAPILSAVPSPRLPDLLATLQEQLTSSESESRSESDSDSTQTPAIILRPASTTGETSGLDIQIHPDKAALRRDENSDARYWHELAEHEKAAWKERLVLAGEWAEVQGEKALFGLLFSEMAGFVGDMAQ